VNFLDPVTSLDSVGSLDCVTSLDSVVICARSSYIFNVYSNTS
jgi:hypothetical protein